MTTKRLLAVDLGASGGKCFAGTVGPDGFRMDEVHRFAHEGVAFHLPDRRGTVAERAHWDDTFIYQQIVRGLLAYRRAHGSGLDAIGIDTWGADGMMVSADGEQIGKVYCYRDHRLDTMIEEVAARIDRDRIYAITGIHFQPFNLSNQLLWFVTRRKDLLRACARFLPMPTLFYHYLGGGQEIDSTWASITQLMDARRHRWSAEILRGLGIPSRLLPAIVEPGARVGTLRSGLAAAAGVDAAALIAVGSHDTASAFAAAPVADADRALIVSSGTWSLVGRLVPRPITTAEAMAANLSNEGGIGNTRLLKNCMGTWIVQELLRVWETADGHRMAWAEVERLAAAAPAFAGFIDPDDRGFFNPANMEQAIRDYLARTRQPAPADRGCLLRLVYESLALQYRRVEAQIASVVGTPADAVHIVGGGSRSALLNQFAANALRRTVLAGPEDATAVGNLMVQAVGVGALPDLAAAQPLIRAAFPIREFRPADDAAWDAAFMSFQRCTSPADQRP
jgi:sugar (pentulose or hexulose) kinase